MRSILKFFWGFVVMGCVMWGGEEVRADYGMPPVEEIFGGEDVGRLSVVDVEIVGFDGEEKARTSVYGVLVGKYEGTALYGVVYTCFGGSLKMYGAEAGQRYVIFLLGDAQMEEQSRFPVVVEGRVAYVMLSDFYANWLGLKDKKLSVEALRVHLESLLERHQQ